MLYLGVDYGLRYVGLALGDDETRIASPYKTIDQTEGDIFAILKEVVAREGIEAVVVGMPLRHSSDPTRHPRDSICHPRESGDPIASQADVTQRFIERLKQNIDVPVYEQNERYTSKQSQQHRKEGSAADEHSIAAMLILQSFLDSTLTPSS